MSQCRRTTFDELYSVIVALVEKVTARKTWRKMGMQVAPRGPYATVYLKEGPSAAQDVVIDDLEAGAQYPIGLTRLECKVEFFRNVTVQPALEAATRFRQSLQLESRFYDLWQIAGLVGEIRIIDVSEMFRADIEGRAELHFNLYADIGAPPLEDQTDNGLGQIDQQPIGVYRTTGDPPPFTEISIPEEVV